MKDEDVRIGMKVQKKGDKENVYVVKGRTENFLQNFYFIKNIKSGMRIDINVSEFEPYIDIELTAEQLSKALDSIKEILVQQLQPIIDFVEKNKDTFKKLLEESKEEKLEKEIISKLYQYERDEIANCRPRLSETEKGVFRAGYLAGRESIQELEGVTMRIYK